MLLRIRLKRGKRSSRAIGAALTRFTFPRTSESITMGVSPRMAPTWLTKSYSGRLSKLSVTFCPPPVVRILAASGTGAVGGLGGAASAGAPAGGAAVAGAAEGWTSGRVRCICWRRRSIASRRWLSDVGGRPGSWTAHPAE